MAKCEIVAGSVDQTIDVFIQDSSVTTGAGLTGLVFNTANLVCYYRKGATGTPTALSLVTQTVGGAHSDGGFVAVDGTNCPGQYRLDLSDTIVATPGRVTIYLRGAANMTPCLVEIEIVAVNKYDAVRGGLTALPNANAEAAGGLITLGTGTGQLTVSSGTVTIGTNNDKTGYSLSQSFPANFASLAITGGGAVTIGTNNDKTGYSLSQAFPANFASLGINVSGHISRTTLVDTVTTYTGNTPQTGDSYANTTPGALRTAVGLASANLDTQLASRASQTTVDAIQAKTDNLPSDPADQSLIITATNSLASTLGTPALASMSADIAAIQAKTVNLPPDPADQSLVIAATDSLASTLGTTATAAGTAATVVSSVVHGNAALKTLIDSVQVVTAALTSGAAAKLALSTGEMYAGSVDNTVAPTATVFEADNITEATADHFKDRTVIFTSGALKGQARVITAYSLVAGRGRFTVAALTEAPANNDQFLII